MEKTHINMSLTENIDYIPVDQELRLFEVAYAHRTPLLLIGPTGCGKTQLVEHMAVKLDLPLVTVTCHDDLMTADLVGRHLIRGGDVIWQDGPLTSAMRKGAICYLDELVEARSDTLAVLHSVADHRRTLFLDRIEEELVAAPQFMLVASYNPRRKGSPKVLKTALRQRFATIKMGYLPDEKEATIVVARTGIDLNLAKKLVSVAAVIRDATDRDTQNRFDQPSTRTLILAGEFMAAGATFGEAVEACMVSPLSTDESVLIALRELVSAAVSED